MKRHVLTLLAFVIGCLPLFAQNEQPPAVPVAPPEAIARWQDMRFGMFVHWGPVSLKGTEIGWSRGREVPIEEYDALHKRFNPIRFNALQWARTAKAAGMKYLVLTTKHHDGFCLWDSAATEFDIMSTPFGRDVVKELSEACRKEGIAFGTYYSSCDWYHPAFPLGSPGGRTEKPNPDLKAYGAYLQQQTTELVTKYGPLLTIWFDVPQSYDAELGIPMVTKLRAMQPDILINNRAYAEPGRTTKFNQQRSVGDYDTPEQRIGVYQDDRPWETCMTICRQWAWKPDDKMKSLEECIRTLVTCAGGNGNLLFNVGPMPDGRIETRQIERLEEMGGWLEKHGESIYGTRGGPIKPGPGFVTTRKGNTMYLHVLPEAPEPIELPGLPRKIVKAEVIGGEEVNIEVKGDSWFVSLPAAVRQPIDTVVKITFDSPVMDLEAIGVPKELGPAKASNVYLEDDAHYGPDKAFDGDPGTRWATDTGTGECWLETQLAKPASIRGIEIDEARDYAGRVEKFSIKVKSGTEWKTVAEGSKLGRFRAEFDPVEVTAIRLEISQANEGPTISEVRVLK